MGEMVSYTVFGTGAIVFPLLTLAYWRELRRRDRKAGEWSILAFSLVSASAYLLNLAWMSGVAAGEWPGETLRWLAAGLAGLMVALAGGRWWAVSGVVSLGFALRAAAGRGKRGRSLDPGGGPSRRRVDSVCAEDIAGGYWERALALQREQAYGFCKGALGGASCRTMRF